LSPPPERRRIVLDEDINWKLAQELIRRGRPDATAVRLIGLNEKKDAALFKAMAQGNYEPFVLVTYDNKMLAAHAAEITHHGTTIAAVDEDAFKASGQPAREQEAYIRDVVHRWLHRIEKQAAGTARLYSSRGSRPG
jgi:predicted nuclease of predicted toxin-antitoxin system